MKISKGLKNRVEILLWVTVLLIFAYLLLDGIAAATTGEQLIPTQKFKREFGKIECFRLYPEEDTGPESEGTGPASQRARNRVDTSFTF
jgi:hypothetical protein